MGMYTSECLICLHTVWDITTPKLLAYKGNHTETAELLIHEGTNVDCRDWICLE